MKKRLLYFILVIFTIAMLFIYNINGKQQAIATHISYRANIEHFYATEDDSEEEEGETDSDLEDDIDQYETDDDVGDEVEDDIADDDEDLGDDDEDSYYGDDEDGEDPDYTGDEYYERRRR